MHVIFALQSAYWWFWSILCWSLAYSYLPLIFSNSLNYWKSVRGMMYYRKALMLQAYLERMSAGGLHFYKIVPFFSVSFWFSLEFLCRPMPVSDMSWLISDVEAGIVGNETTDVQGFELSPEARAQADIKFTYVVTCQIYGKQKEDQKPEAADIALLMQRFCHCTKFSISNWLIMLNETIEILCYNIPA